MTVTDPLLCLTVSATLREKPLAFTQPKHPLALYFASVGQPLTVPGSPTTPNEAAVETTEDKLDGLEEVNLLEGLLAGERIRNTIYLSTPTASPQAPPLPAKEMHIYFFLQRVSAQFPDKSSSPFLPYPSPPSQHPHHHL